VGQLRVSDPDIPADNTNDRARDNWRPLLSIADLAGGEWPQKARTAARAMAGAEADSGSARTLILKDLQVLFDEHGDVLDSEIIITLLTDIEERPWGEWKNGRPITKVGLARLLKPFGIQPKKWREGQKTRRGYERSDFEEVFTRYLGIESPHSPQGQESTTYSENKSPQDTPSVATRNGANLLETSHVASVATYPEMEREEF
jgi:putative DNA primase/helicase